MTFRQIKGFEGIYSISENGKVSSIRRSLGKRLMKNRIKPNGYVGIKLCNNGKQFHLSIHRLVALHFVDNPNNYPEVNHKDGNKENNHYLNLEWVTSSENQKHAFRLVLQKVRKGKDHVQSIPINQLDLNGNFVKSWESIKQVKRELGFNTFGIIKCCKNEKRYKTAYGFKWEYKYV